MREFDEQLDSLIGVWVLDQYRLIKQIGGGGMGRVYLADQPSMQRKASVKILKASEAHSTLDRLRFQREARAVSRLAHPNIVSVFNFGELGDGTLFLAMEFVVGDNLRKLISRARMPALRAINLTYQIAAALGYAHSRKIVHRDLKPENVMITRLIGRDHIKVLDFGIARIQDETSISAPELILGTPEYLSPEQCACREATSLSDQYSLGLVLYEMLTGVPAFAADSPLEFLRLHAEGPPLRPSSVHDEAELAILDPIIEQLTAKVPEDRFNSMDALQVALNEAVEKILFKPGPTAATPVEAPELQREDEVTTQDMLAGSLLRVQILEDAGVLNPRGRDSLQHHGITTASEPLPFSAIEDQGQLEDCDILLLATNLERWRMMAPALKKHPRLSKRLLLCVDELLTTPELHDLADQVLHVSVGKFPQHPTSIGFALRWMLNKDLSVIETMGDQSTVQVCQITSHQSRTVIVDSLIDDLQVQGLRQSAIQSCRETADELVCNAIMHTVTPSDGDASTKGHDESVEGASTFRWVVGQQHIALSMRDHAGAISPRQILAHTTGNTPNPRSLEGGEGAGLGLRIVSRAAQHLLFMICPGQFSEVVALVPRRPVKNEERTVSVLMSGDVEKKRIGTRLWLSIADRTTRISMALSGEIDASADLTAVFGASGHVSLDLSQITSINSLGIQKWLEANRERPDDLDLVFKACSQAMVRQFAFLPMLEQTGRIYSFLAPYFCGACNKESMELLHVLETKHAIPPVRNCARCGSVLEFAEEEDQYFAFLPGVV